MISDRSKRIFLGVCIIVPFFLYCFYYYSIRLGNAPYRYTDFESIVLKYGENGELVNHFDSSTGVFQYLDARDSLIIDTIRFKEDDKLYLHRKAADLGFWNVDDDMTMPLDTAANAKPVPRYFLQYNYKEKSKTITLDANFDGHPKMVGAAKSVIDEVRRVMADARDRQRVD